MAPCLSPTQLHTLLALRAAARESAHDTAAQLVRSVIASEGECEALVQVPLESRHHDLAQRQVTAIEAFGIHVLPAWSLPEFLKQVRPLPLLLFVRGSLASLSTAAVGIVGSRAASVDAARWAYERAAAFAKRATTVVSGGARGIDAAAHQGALDAGGATIAYLGSAIDRPYPASNRALFTRILRGGGALVSEHPPLVGTPAFEHAKRNRFIAAHADPLLIASAAAASGTLGTAEYARKYGRQIRVAPTEVHTQREGLSLLLERGWAQLDGA